MSPQDRVCGTLENIGRVAALTAILESHKHAAATENYLLDLDLDEALLILNAANWELKDLILLDKYLFIRTANCGDVKDGTFARPTWADAVLIAADVMRSCPFLSDSKHFKTAVPILLHTYAIARVAAAVKGGVELQHYVLNEYKVPEPNTIKEKMQRYAAEKAGDQSECTAAPIILEANTQARIESVTLEKARSRDHIRVDGQASSSDLDATLSPRSAEIRKLRADLDAARKSRDGYYHSIQWLRSYYNLDRYKQLDPLCAAAFEHVRIECERLRTKIKFLENGGEGPTPNPSSSDYLEANLGTHEGFARPFLGTTWPRFPLVRDPDSISGYVIRRWWMDADHPGPDPFPGPNPFPVPVPEPRVTQRIGKRIGRHGLQDRKRRRVDVYGQPPPARPAFPSPPCAAALDRGDGAAKPQDDPFVNKGQASGSCNATSVTGNANIAGNANVAGNKDATGGQVWQGCFSYPAPA